MPTKQDEAREFLNELNQLITRTDLSIIREAKTNVQIRTQRASTNGENLELWYRLMDLLDACEKCKRVIQ